MGNEVKAEYRGIELPGQMWVAGGLVTVTTSDGRQKTTQVGGSPPDSIARMMLIELERERLGDPLFKRFTTDDKA
jgi:hypothetical protein